MRTVLIAGILATTAIAHADTKGPPLNDLYNPAWGFTRTEAAIASIITNDILNSYCIVMTGKSLIGTPGYASYVIPKILAQLEDAMPPTRRVEIYDMIFDQLRAQGDPRIISEKEWTAVCNKHRANQAPLMTELLKELEK